MKQIKPLFVMRDRERAWKSALFKLLLTPVLVLLALYYFPFILWNETFAKWSLRGLMLLWLMMVAWEIRDLLLGNDVLLVMNDYGIWAKGCALNSTIAWERVVDVIEIPDIVSKRLAKIDGLINFQIMYRPDEPSDGKIASFMFNSGHLNLDPEIIRTELRNRLADKLVVREYGGRLNA